MPDFAANVRSCRKAKGMTQKELGEKINVTQTVIHNYEDGKITPKPVTLVRLAKALDVTVEELVMGVKTNV